MKVKELIEALAKVDPELEVGHAIPDVTGYVSAVSGVSIGTDGQRRVLVLETDRGSGTLFPDEVEFEDLP